jgi:hypothetical protein
MSCVLACSIARVVGFVAGPEHLGLDPILALAASAASAYYLLRLLLRR